MDERFNALRVAILRDLDDTFYDDDWRLHICGAERESDSFDHYNNYMTSVPEKISHISHDMNETSHDANLRIQACYNYVRAIIFDLDDTLYDCSGTLVLQGRKHAAKTIARLINCSEEEAYHLQLEMEEKYGTQVNIYEKIATLYNLPDTYARELLEEFVRVDISNIRLFSDVLDTLVQLKTRGCKLILVTSGEKQIQRKKIDVLGLSDRYFDEILITDRNNDQAKKDCFKEIMHRYNLKPEEILCVGDKINDELTAGKSLGIITVMFQHGRHFKAYLKQRDQYIKPDYSIEHMKDLLGLKVVGYL